MTKRTCSVPGCERDHYCKGYCSPHYQRWRKSGDPGPAGIMEMSKSAEARACAVDGCDRPYLARGYCSAHWQRWKATGDPGGAEITKQHKRCTVAGCDGPNYGRGYCSPHWRRWKRHGDPTATPMAAKYDECTVEGCTDAHSARGYCASHYARWRRTGQAGPAFSVRRRDPSTRDEQGRKQCRGCDEWLPELAFHKSISQRDGLAPNCPDCHHAAFIARRYGVEPSWYAETLRRQGGGCAVCGATPRQRRLHIDHDHSHCSSDRGCPKCVRGLLCSPCNTGLGMLGEDTARLLAAAAYLQEYGVQSDGRSSRQV